MLGRLVCWAGHGPIFDMGWPPMRSILSGLNRRLDSTYMSDVWGSGIFVGDGSLELGIRRWHGRGMPAK